MFSCHIARVSLTPMVQGFPKCQVSVMRVLSHALAIATTAGVCQLRCHCPSWQVPYSYSKRTLCCRSYVFSALRCSDAKSEIPPEQGRWIITLTKKTTNNYTHLGQRFSIQLIHLLFSYLYTSAHSLSGFSTDNMELCSHTSGPSVLYSLWTFSIITGSRSWICFFLPLSKGQGNMKLQKSNSSPCHFCVSPEGNMAMVFLMLPPPSSAFSIHSPWHIWWQVTQ